jgi:hypothetical protein
VIRIRDPREKVHVALIRRRTVERLRTEDAVAGLFEHDGFAAVVKSQATQLRRDLGGEYPGLPRLDLELRP